MSRASSTSMLSRSLNMATMRPVLRHNTWSLMVGLLLSLQFLLQYNADNYQQYLVV